MVDVAISAAYQSVDTNGGTDVAGNVYGTDNWTEISVGTSVGFAGFTVGGGYAQDKDIFGVSDNDSKAWSAGLKYGMGPWAVGVQYSKLTNEPVVGADTDQTTWVIGGQYTLGPGITAFGGLQINDNDLAASTAGRMAGQTNTFFVGTALSF